MSVEYERRPHYASWLVRPARTAVRATRPDPRPRDRDDIDLSPYRARQRLPPPPPLSSAGPASEPGGGAAARACFSLLSSYDGVFYSLDVTYSRNAYSSMPPSK